jgi:hypothetical protein
MRLRLGMMGRFHVRSENTDLQSIGLVDREHIARIRTAHRGLREMVDFYPLYRCCR